MNPRSKRVISNEVYNLVAQAKANGSDVFPEIEMDTIIEEEKPEEVVAESEKKHWGRKPGSKNTPIETIREAVAFYNSSRMTIQEVAAKYDVSTATISNWIAKLRHEPAKGSSVVIYEKKGNPNAGKDFLLSIRVKGSKLPELVSDADIEIMEIKREV